MSERLLSRESSRERKGRAVQAERPPQFVAVRQRRNPRRRIGQDADLVGADAPGERELAQVRAGREDVRGVPQLQVTREAQERNRGTAPTALEVVHVTLDEAATA